MFTLIYIKAALIYVASDPYFWVSMAFTTIMGMFIAAAIYDGQLKEIKKFLIGLGGYASLLIMTTGARIIPYLSQTPGDFPYMPLAGIATVFYLTVFYLFGMCLGVCVSHCAHKRG